MITQVLVNGLYAASIVALMALGFGLIFSVTRFFHFAHGVVLAAGAYGAFFVYQEFHCSVPVACVGGICASIAVGCAMELAVYRPLRLRGASALTLLLASLGLYVALQNVISMFFGDATQRLQFTAAGVSLSVLGATLTPVQAAAILASTTCVTATAVYLHGTRMGRALRAVACDVELARLAGVESDTVVLVVFALGSALAGLAGVFLALDVGMFPTMGLRPLMMGIVAMVIGGVGGVASTLTGAVFLGMALQLGVWEVGAQWQDAIAFAILLVFLAVRPRGFLGRTIRRTAA